MIPYVCVSICVGRYISVLYYIDIVESMLCWLQDEPQLVLVTYWLPEVMVNFNTYIKVKWQCKSHEIAEIIT